MDIAEFLMGGIFGAVAGVIGSVVLQRPLERWYSRFRSCVRRWMPKRVTGPDRNLRELGLIQLLSWSPSRPFDPDRHEVAVRPSSAEEQNWFPNDIWVHEAASAGERVSGLTSYISSYSVDNGEAGERSKGVRLEVSPSRYSDGVAVQSLTSSSDHLWARVAALFDQDPSSALSTAPPQTFFVALTLVTPDGYCLASRRSSGGVITSGGLWTLAACETMRAIPDFPGSGPETLVELAYRAAKEEFGLSKQEIHTPWISWMGFSKSDGLFAVAHAMPKIRLTSDELMNRFESAEGGYEADATRWIHLDSDEFHDLCKPQVRDNWVSFNPVVAQGLARVFGSLDQPPRRA